MIDTGTPLETGFNWHLVCLLLFAVLNGIGGFVISTPSTAIAIVFPGAIKYVWFGGLIIGGAMGLTGYLMRAVKRAPAERTNGVLIKWVRYIVLAITIERTALLLLTGLCVGYICGVIAILLDRPSTAFGAAAIVAFAVANIARTRQLKLALRRVQGRLNNDNNSGDST